MGVEKWANEPRRFVVSDATNLTNAGGRETLGKIIKSTCGCFFGGKMCCGQEDFEASWCDKPHGHSFIKKNAFTLLEKIKTRWTASVHQGKRRGDRPMNKKTKKVAFIVNPKSAGKKKGVRYSNFQPLKWKKKQESSVGRSNGKRTVSRF